MPSVRLRIEATAVDGIAPDFPLVRRLETNENASFTLQLASSGSYQQLAAIAHIATIAGYLLAFDRQVTVRTAAQSDAGQVVNAGGILAAIDTAISNASNNGILVLFNGGGTLTVRGQVYGE